MKVVWVTCSILCACALLCCLGLFLAGKSVLEATRRADAQADSFALETVNAVCRKWDEKELSRRLSPDADSGLATRVLAQSKSLGTLEEAYPFSATSSGFRNVNGVRTTRVTVSGDAKFEHASAHLTLILEDTGSGWSVADFQIDNTSAPQRRDV